MHVPQLGTPWQHPQLPSVCWLQALYVCPPPHDLWQLQLCHCLMAEWCSHPGTCSVMAPRLAHSMVQGVVDAGKLQQIEAMCRKTVQQHQEVYTKPVSLALAEQINGEAGSVLCSTMLQY